MNYFFIFIFFINSVNIISSQISHGTVSKKYIIDFNLRRDTLTFLHIQKTSGSYWINEMKKNLLVLNGTTTWSHICTYDKTIQNYDCYATNGGFHRSSELFWNSNEDFECDIHAGYNELINCIKKDFRINTHGTIHIMTMLRAPFERYVSEYEHVKRGATWKKAIRHCMEQPIYSNHCYYGNDWSNVEWSAFLDCEYNLANNRQVRMLANYYELGCGKLKCWIKGSNCSLALKKRYEEDILENAKKNLVSMGFFGLAEYQSLSQYLFEKTFQNRFMFTKAFSVNKERVGLESVGLKLKCYKNDIYERNSLDVRLFEFARRIFFERVHYFKRLDLKKV
jgi:heparan sulfate 6-O-sulfotransferase HS6ST1